MISSNNIMAELSINVYIAIEEKYRTITWSASKYVEKLCTILCKELNISPIARNLFALQLHDSKLFLTNSSKLEKNCSLNLRIRFKVPNVSHLQSLDVNAYNYYFHQARKDILNNNIPEIIYSKHKEELLGLGIADMYRVMIDEKKNIPEIMKDYKKYIPPEITKKHLLFAKKPIYNTLSQLQKNNLSSSYVVEKFLIQLESLAPNYLFEDYKVKIDKNGALSDGILTIMPFHKEQPGLRIHFEKKNEWEHLCTIAELCFMTIREYGNTIEISRANGIPINLEFETVRHMYSFVSNCDGYYRLMSKWTFNLCKDVFSPLLKELHSLKCHGPIGGKFSYYKLEEKRSNKPGCFILRQCEVHYDVFFIDICTKNWSKPLTYKIEKIENGYIFNGEPYPVYKSIIEIINAHKSADKEIQMIECLPPSEYDKSQLLLCEPSKIDNINPINHVDLESLLANDNGPRYIAIKDLQLYRGTRIEGAEKVTYLYKARWNFAQDKKINVAMKMLKQESNDKFFREFIEHTGQWALLKSNAIVRLYGITLRSPVGMILEYMPYGPLNEYLKQQTIEIQVVDLVEASASLATAIWHLSDNGIVHGNIRCRKLLVAAHDSNKFTVKLSDMGLHSSYNDYEIHWIAIEYHNNIEIARKSTASDVWALATTMWEIFSFGNSPADIPKPLTKKNYSNGMRLPAPNDCPKDIYTIMCTCWYADLHERSRPHTIMRDVNHLLYQVYSCCRTNNYASPKNTESTVFSNEGGILGFIGPSDAEGDTFDYNNRKSSLTDDGESDTISSDLSNQLDYDFSNKNVDQSQDIYEFEGYNVVLQGIIGRGNFGEVYKGSLQKDGNYESRVVAVKKVITTETSQLDDFHQETMIALTLKHANIVEILGVVDKPDTLLIMEFIPNGSLKCYLSINRESIKNKQLLKYALDIAAGMQYLESMKVVHRDLAARNILVVNEDQVKISDFGLSRKMDTKGYYLMQSNRALPLYWYAPESKKNGRFSSKSDVWSYGVTSWEMFSYGKEPPNWDQDLTQDKVPTRLPSPVNCPNEIYRDLMIACWQSKPCERPSFRQLYENCEKLMTDLSLD